MVRDDDGFALVKLVIVAAIAVPVGIYSFNGIRSAVRNETLRSDISGAIQTEALCNQELNGAGYSPGSNAPAGGAFRLQCGAATETVRVSAGNLLTISVAPDGRSYVISGLQRATGKRISYASAGAHWS